MLLTTLALADTPASGSNRHFQHTVTTDAPAAAIWARWADPTTWHEWDHALESAQANEDLRLGSTGELVSGGRASRFTITEWDPEGRRYAFTTRLPLGSLVVTRYIEPSTPTRFTHDVRFTGVGGALLAPMLGPKFRRALPGVMESLSTAAGRPLP